MNRAFDIVEAHWVFACDYGEYATLTRLHAMQFHPGPLLTRATLTDDGRRIYAYCRLRRRRGEPIYRAEKIAAR